MSLPTNQHTQTGSIQPAPPAVSVKTQDSVSVITGDQIVHPADTTAILNVTGDIAPPRAQPNITIPTSGTKLQAKAASLISDFTISEGYQNLKPRIQMVELNVVYLHKTFENSIRPIIYGNYRNLGLHGFTAAADLASLNHITYTVAANAVASALIVLYNKAVSIDNSLASYFNRDQSTGSTKFPALLSLLVQSLGPYKTTTSPYKCYFIPYIDGNDVVTLLRSNDYNPEYQLTFNQAMTRSKQICMTDIDFNSKESTPWWMLHRAFSDDTTDRTSNTTIFNPTEFQNRTASVTLASVCLHSTLYEPPGPCYSAVIGPFAFKGVPTTIDDIPEPFTDSFYYNQHVPAVDHRFRCARGPESDPPVNLTHAELYTFATLQENTQLSKDISLKKTEIEEEPDQSGSKTRSKRRRIVGYKIPKQTLDADKTNDKWNIYICEVVYFDHIMFYDLPYQTKTQIVTEANSL